jgi:shikimate dehydrogenase
MQMARVIPPMISGASNVTGALITMPYKVQVLGLVDEVSTTAPIAGAANAVRANADGT